MRKVSFPSPPFPGQELQWLVNAVHEIELASEEDVAVIADNFVVLNATPLRTLDASTATLADLVSFVGTFITDIKTRGANRAQ